MTFGIRVRDASGNITLDMTDRMPRFFASYNWSIGTQGQTTISVPGYTTDGTWFYFLGVGAPNVRVEHIAGGFRLTNGFNFPVSGVLNVLRT